MNKLIKELVEIADKENIELILAPILNEKILEDIMIKINAEVLEAILEDSFDFEEKKNYYN